MRALARTLAVLVGCALGATGCERSPVGPPPSENVLVGLRIEPATTTLRVGTTRQLQLLAVYLDGSSAPVTGQDWTSTPNGVAIIDTQGNVTALRLGIATVSTSFSNFRAALVLSITNEEAGGPFDSFSATWNGEALNESCIRLVGPGPSPCRVGHTFGFSLTLNQSGYSLSGALSLGGAEGSVQGWRDVFGRIFLTGKLQSPETAVEITDWSTLVSPPGIGMTGTFEFVEKFTNSFGAQVLVQAYRLVDVRR